MSEHAKIRELEIEIEKLRHESIDNLALRESFKDVLEIATYKEGPFEAVIIRDAKLRIATEALTAIKQVSHPDHEASRIASEALAALTEL